MDRRHSATGDLTVGGITGTMLRFAAPLMAGNLLQQAYNIVDTLIVGRFLGASALAAVGSSYTLMVFITSVFIGLCMGSGAVFSMQYGARNFKGLRRSLFSSLLLIGAVTVVLNLASLLLLQPIVRWLQVPAQLVTMTCDYLFIVLLGMIGVSLYNFCAFLLRSLGNSMVPLLFLAFSVVLNIVLDLLFIAVFDWGVSGAAAATVIAQYAAAAGLVRYLRVKFPELWPRRGECRFDRQSLREIFAFSSLTCLQQSVMNFGILMVQGLVNRFGVAVMAAFAAAVKIDSFAYMPVQDFGNAFSTFVAQNFGAGRMDRIRRGVRSALLVTTLFSLSLSAIIFWAAPALMRMFVTPGSGEIVRIGVTYLRVEGSFYLGIGLLFLLYGFYRAVRMPALSVVLTVLSLGTRVLLAYLLAAIPTIGVNGIWWSIPIGWLLADAFGIICYMRLRNRLRMAPDAERRAAA